MESTLLNTNLTWEDFKDDVVLDSQSNHLFKIDIDKYYPTIELNFKTLLTEKELAKSIRYKNNIDQRRYIVSKYFLRVILSKFIDIPASEIRFKHTAKKKPAIVGIEFNVTHSGRLVLIAISQVPIGIDLEFINPSFDFNPLLANCFHQEEIAFLKTTNEKAVDFYSFWTRKEAILKASGEGLIDEMDQLNCLKDNLTRKDIKYYLNSFLIDNIYVASMATSRKNDTLNCWNY